MSFGNLFVPWIVGKATLESTMTIGVHLLLALMDVHDASGVVIWRKFYLGFWQLEGSLGRLRLLGVVVAAVAGKWWWWRWQWWRWWWGGGFSTTLELPSCCSLINTRPTHSRATPGAALYFPFCLVFATALCCNWGGPSP